MTQSTGDRPGAPDRVRALLAEMRTGAVTSQDRAVKRLTGARNNAVWFYRETPGAPPVCVKIYRVDDRRRADREWDALTVLARHRKPWAPRPLWHDPHPDAPAAGMTVVPGVPVLQSEQSARLLPRLVEIVAEHQTIPLEEAGVAARERIDSCGHFLRRVEEVWPAQLDADPLDPLHGDMRALLDTWLAGPDRITLARPVRAVWSHGDSNLDNWLHPGGAGSLSCVDYEFAGRSDVAFDAAELIEHISGRAIPDRAWARVGPQLGVADDPRFPAARRLCALRWLAVLWKQRTTRTQDFIEQHQRTRRLLSGET